MRSEPEPDLTDEPRSEGLGGFGEAGSIQPGVADEKTKPGPDVPTAPADPNDAPAPNGPLNPA